MESAVTHGRPPPRPACPRRTVRLGAGRRNHRRQDPLVRPAGRLRPRQRRRTTRPAGSPSSTPSSPSAPSTPCSTPATASAAGSSSAAIRWHLADGGACSSACCATSTAAWTVRSATTTSCRSSAAPSAIRSQVTYVTCALHCLSYGSSTWPCRRTPQPSLPFALTLVILGWVTWASNAMALLLKRVGDHLGRLNAALQENQAELEARIAERTRELQEAQAQCCIRKRWPRSACWPPASPTRSAIRSRRSARWCRCCSAATDDAYTLEKLAPGQRPAPAHPHHPARTDQVQPAGQQRADRVAAGEILDEALNIAKYYKRTRGRIAAPPLPPDLPPLFGVRDQLVQVFLNLVLNAIDATDRDGRIELAVSAVPARRRGRPCATTAAASPRNTRPSSFSRISRRRSTAPAWACS